MTYYTLVWIHETEKFHLFEGFINEVDLDEKFKDGYVVYEIEAIEDGTITLDTLNIDNEGKNLYEVYNQIDTSLKGCQ